MFFPCLLKRVRQSYTKIYYGHSSYQKKLMLAFDYILNLRKVFD